MWAFPRAFMVLLTTQHLHTTYNGIAKPNITINIVGFHTSGVYASAIAVSAALLPRSCSFVHSKCFSAGILQCVNVSMCTSARKLKWQGSSMALHPPSHYPFAALDTHSHVSHATWIIYNNFFDCSSKKKLIQTVKESEKEKKACK